MSISKPEHQLFKIALLDCASDIEVIKGGNNPEELIDLLYQGAKKALIDEILQYVKTIPPDYFEKLVVDLLVKMGYGGSREEAGQVVGGSYDEGVDGIINEDRLGLDVIYIQAKRWRGTVGRPEIQKFAGALQGKRARKGVFITTSEFSSEAILYASSIDINIVLIDGLKLANMMIDFNVGVSPVRSFELKCLDMDYFNNGGSG